MATPPQPSEDPGLGWVPPAFSRRAAAARWWKDSDDTTLARGIETKDDHALAELRDRYSFLLDRLAKVHCSHLGHRNGHCPGLANLGCDQAYTSAYRVLAEQLPKKFARQVLHGGARVGTALGTHSHGTHTDVLRAWNADRGIVVRPRPKGPTLDILTETIGEWAATSDAAAAARVDGIDVPTDPQRWIDALHADACQPADPMIDHRRVLRRLLHEPGGAVTVSIPDDLPPSVVEAINEVDAHIAAVVPDQYDRWLDRPRQQTRPGRSYQTSGIETLERSK